METKSPRVLLGSSRYPMGWNLETQQAVARHRRSSRHFSEFCGLGVVDGHHQGRTLIQGQASRELQFTHTARRLRRLLFVPFVQRRSQNPEAYLEQHKDGTQREKPRDVMLLVVDCRKPSRKLCNGNTREKGFSAETTAQIQRQVRDFEIRDPGTKTKDRKSREPAMSERIARNGGLHEVVRVESSLANQPCYLIKPHGG